MSNYIHIGKFVATFGLQGELILKHALQKKTAFKNVKVLFAEEVKDSHIPYFLQQAKVKDTEEAYIKLEGIDTKEKARRFVQKKVWLQEEDFRMLAGKTSPISLLSFLLINEGETLGPIEEVIEQPHQVLLRITLDNKEALIPLHDETLKKIDRNKKEVHVILPDGLLDVYK